jgi:hypothetical protein
MKEQVEIHPDEAISTKRKAISKLLPNSGVSYRLY